MNLLNYPLQTANTRFQYPELICLNPYIYIIYIYCFNNLIPVIFFSCRMKICYWADRTRCHDCHHIAKYASDWRFGSPEQYSVWDKLPCSFDVSYDCWLCYLDMQETSAMLQLLQTSGGSWICEWALCAEVYQRTISAISDLCLKKMLQPV